MESIFNRTNSKHTSQHAMKFFESQGINLLPWSGQSADINIMKPVWSHLDNQVCKQSLLPCNLDELWDTLKEKWGRLDTDYIARLYESIPCCLQAVKGAMG